MNYLFSSKGLQSLDPFLTKNSLLAFDFDGTLAPIVSNPKKAALPKRSATLLKKLSARAPVVLISGRSLSDLKSKIPFKVVARIGNHGMEGLPGNSSFARSVAKNTLEWEKSLAESLSPYPDVSIENKKYSLTLHYRSSKNRTARKKLLLSLVAKLYPQPRITPGKCVLNILSRGQMHKGDAIKHLLDRKKISRAIFVGDDDTDEDVFRMKDPRIFSIRVGLRKGSKANAYLLNQEEMEHFLRLLLQRQGTK